MMTYIEIILVQIYLDWVFQENLSIRFGEKNRGAVSDKRKNYLSNNKDF